jgi:hypothetical protein
MEHTKIIKQLKIEKVEVQDRSIMTPVFNEAGELLGSLGELATSVEDLFVSTKEPVKEAIGAFSDFDISDFSISDFSSIIRDLESLKTGKFILTIEEVVGDAEEAFKDAKDFAEKVGDFFEDITESVSDYIYGDDGDANEPQKSETLTIGETTEVQD